MLAMSNSWINTLLGSITYNAVFYVMYYVSCGEVNMNTCTKFQQDWLPQGPVISYLGSRVWPRSNHLQKSEIPDNWSLRQPILLNFGTYCLSLSSPQHRRML